MSSSAATRAKRYARQIALQSVGVTGQQTLLRSAVAVPGTGPAAAIAARYLVAAGIGCCFTDASVAAELEALNPEPTVLPLAQAPSATMRAEVKASDVAFLRGLSHEHELLPELLGSLAASEALLTLLELSGPHQPPEQPEP